jgi:serine/threonine-protein kinase RsbW
MCDQATVPLRCVTPMRPHMWVRSFPGRHDQVGQARAFLACFLDGRPGADEAVLLVSELAANAVTHSASGRPGGTFTVRARIHCDGCIYAEVEDHGSGWDGDVSAAECPHGLFLLRQLASDCGARRGERGWVTWFTLSNSVAAGRMAGV